MGVGVYPATRSGWARVLHWPQGSFPLRCHSTILHRYFCHSISCLADQHIAESNTDVTDRCLSERCGKQPWGTQVQTHNLGIVVSCIPHVSCVTAAHPLNPPQYEGKPFSLNFSKEALNSIVYLILSTWFKNIHIQMKCAATVELICNNCKHQNSVMSELLDKAFSSCIIMTTLFSIFQQLLQLPIASSDCRPGSPGP